MNAQKAIAQRDQTARSAQQILFWMSSPAISIGEEASLADALALMHEHSIRRLPVIDTSGQLRGIITEGDIRGVDVMHALGSGEAEIARALRRTTVHETMTASPIRVTPTTTLREAAELMLDNKIGGIPVIENGDAVVGMITESDLFEALVCYLDIAAERDQ